MKFTMKIAALAAIVCLLASVSLATPKSMLIAATTTNQQTTASTATNSAVGYVESLAVWSTATVANSATATVTVIEYSGATALRTLYTGTVTNGTAQWIYPRVAPTSNAGVALNSTNTLIQTAISGNIVISATPSAAESNATWYVNVIYDNGSIVN